MGLGGDVMCDVGVCECVWGMKVCECDGGCLCDVNGGVCGGGLCGCCWEGVDK